MKIDTKPALDNTLDELRSGFSGEWPELITYAKSLFLNLVLENNNQKDITFFQELASTIRSFEYEMDHWRRCSQYTEEDPCKCKGKDGCIDGYKRINGYLLY